MSDPVAKLSESVVSKAQTDPFYNVNLELENLVKLANKLIDEVNILKGV